MSVKSFEYSKLLWANGVDAGTVATIVAIAAPGVGRRIAIKSYKVNPAAQDIVSIKSGTTEKDRHYLGAFGGYDKDFGNDPLLLNENEAFNILKTQGVTMSWSCQYTVVPI